MNNDLKCIGISTRGSSHNTGSRNEILLPERGYSSMRSDHTILSTPAIFLIDEIKLRRSLPSL